MGFKGSGVGKPNIALAGAESFIAVVNQLVEAVKEHKDGTRVIRGKRAGMA